MRGYFLWFVLLASFLDTLTAHQPDINRLRILPRNSEVSVEGLISAGYADVDHRSGQQLQSAAILQEPRGNPSQTSTKIYQTKEDPQNHYFSSLFKGQNDIQAPISFKSPSIPDYDANKNVGKSFARNQFPKGAGVENLRSNRYHENSVVPSQLCVRCPHDRTVVARPGRDRVYLETPRLVSCEGLPAPRSARLRHLYGPGFGSLLPKGSHLIVSRVIYEGQILQHCKMQVNVVEQFCVAPSYLKTNCSESNECIFSCVDRHASLRGPSRLHCGADMTWRGQLPVCRSPTWCPMPIPPNHGHISCQGSTKEGDQQLSEGTRCRVRCLPGFRASNSLSVCRRGHWTRRLTCL